MTIPLTGAGPSAPGGLSFYANKVAGTLTAANLNTHFGAGKWAWWKLDESA